MSQFLDRGVKALQALYEGSVRLKRLTPDQAKVNLSRLSPTVSYQDIKDVDIVSKHSYSEVSATKLYLYFLYSK